MGTNWFWQKKDKKDERDAAIGRMISRAIKESADPESCPSPEDISDFLDGRLDQKQRDMVMGHLSHCERCYEVFSIAHEMEDRKEEEVVVEKRRNWAYPSFAFAVAASLIIAIGLLIPITGPYTPPSSAQIVTRLAKTTDIKLLSDTKRERHVTGFGFGSGIPQEKVSFRIGVSLMDIEISLMAGDRDKSIGLTKNLAQVLQSLEGSDEIVSFYVAISKNIEEGVPPKQFLGKNKNIEQFFNDKGLLLYLRFGEWTEAGRISALTQNKEFFDVKTTDYFIKNLQGKELPQGVFKTLGEVKAVFIKNEFTDKDFKHLENGFTDLIEMM